LVVACGFKPCLANILKPLLTKINNLLLSNRLETVYSQPFDTKLNKGTKGKWGEYDIDPQ